MWYRWVAVAAIIVAAGCGGSNKSRSAKSGGDAEGTSLSSLIDEKGEQEDKDVIARRQCLGENKKAKECMSDEDCCQGFYCGKDPEVSPRIKVCIDNGG